MRATSLAAIADALWDVDDEQGRAFLREAWDSAEAAGRESRGGLDLRKEVLSSAARRDRALAEEFLQKLRAEQRHEAEASPAGAATPSGPDLWSLPDALEKRLDAAESLLRAGDTAAALQLADPALAWVTISAIDFLTALRQRDPAAAAARYAALLTRVAADALADANTVSVLSS